MQELTVTASALKRRSIKEFETTPIPADVLNQILDVAIAAPSSWNFQPTRIILIQSEAQKQALAAVAWGQKQITQAPVTLVFAADIRGWEKHMDSIIQTAQNDGAWHERTAAFIRENAPGFQKALGDKEREYAIKDAMISASYASLAAEALGLGTCFMNGWDEKGVKQLIGVGDRDDIAIALVLPVGYPKTTPGNPGRLSKEHTIFDDRMA